MGEIQEGEEEELNAAEAFSEAVLNDKREGRM